MTQRLRERLAYRPNDAGFTLVEMLVAMVVFGILSTGVLSVINSTAKSTKASRQYNDLNEEARVMLNRMSRELREASRISAFTNAGPASNSDSAKGPVVPSTCSTFVAPTAGGVSTGAAGNVAITFEVDFNGNGTIEPNAADPEELTYFFDNTRHQVLLQAAGASYPILASNVDAFKVTPLSRQVIYDEKCTAQSSKDGLVYWSDLDADGKPYAQGVAGAAPSAVGNGNGVLDTELGSIDSVVIEVTVLKSVNRQQTYRTQIDLRNRPNQ